MLSLRLLFTSILIALLTVFTANAETVEETTTETTTTTTPGPAPASSSTTTITSPGHTTIITPVPSAKEETVIPSGYVSCTTIQAGWYKDMWVPEHRFCRYQATPGQSTTYQGVAWVDSYWACTQYTSATCTKWEWKPGHWVKTLEENY